MELPGNVSCSEEQGLYSPVSVFLPPGWQHSSMQSPTVTFEPVGSAQ